jgi:hypothetical protein
MPSELSLRTRIVAASARLRAVTGRATSHTSAATLSTKSGSWGSRNAPVPCWNPPCGAPP